MPGSSSSSSSGAANALTPGPAATTMGSTPDIVSHILTFLPSSALSQTLRVSKLYFHLSAPLLYHTIDVRTGMRDISIGSTRSEDDNLTLDSSTLSIRRDSNESSHRDAGDSGGGSRRSHDNDFSKNSLLRLVKRVNVLIHGKNECPFVSSYIQPFPNLQVLHLAGGQRPNDMEPDEVCAYDGSDYGRPFGSSSSSSSVCGAGDMRCQFVRKVCVNARTVILRSMDLSPIRGYDKVEHVVLKLRPCQLPHYTPPRQSFDQSMSAQSGSAGTSSANSDEDDSGHQPIFIGDFNTITMRLPLTVTTLDIVWWDERHLHRIEGYELTLGEESGWYMGRGPSGRRTHRMMGCTYCDQVGCVRYSPHAGVQLPAMMRSLGKDTGVMTVRIWNVDYTAEEQWHQGRLSLSRLKEEMRRQLSHGRKIKINAGGVSQTDLDGMRDPKLSFHSAAEYHARATRSISAIANEIATITDDDVDLDVVCEIDESEEPYWVARIEPPRRLKDLRERVEAIWPMEDKRMLSLWSADELERYLDSYEKDPQDEVEART
ncbi:hypothetical protein IAU59_005704 [Kwoniella sp. CBS 9459]